MADWEAQNTHAPTFAPDNNYDKINNTTVGGQVQSKINFLADVPRALYRTLTASMST